MYSQQVSVSVSDTDTDRTTPFHRGVGATELLTKQRKLKNKHI